MVENFFERPPYEQFKYEQELTRRNAETFGAMVRYWQKELSNYYEMTLTDKGFDLVVAEMFLTRYNDLIKSANTPEEVRQLYKHFVAIIQTGNYILKAAEEYAEKFAEQIAKFEETPVCPCCNGTISPDYIDELKMRYDDIQDQIKFYELFTQQRREDMKRLNDKVRRKEIKVEIWQVPSTDIFEEPVTIYRGMKNVGSESASVG